MNNILSDIEIDNFNKAAEIASKAAASYRPVGK